MQCKKCALDDLIKININKVLEEFSKNKRNLFLFIDSKPVYYIPNKFVIKCWFHEKKSIVLVFEVKHVDYIIKDFILYIDKRLLFHLRPRMRAQGG